MLTECASVWTCWPCVFVPTLLPMLYREEDELISGGVMKAVIQPGAEGGETPRKGDLVGVFA